MEMSDWQLEWRCRMASENNTQKASQVRKVLSYIAFTFFFVAIGCLLYSLLAEHVGWPRLPLTRIGLWAAGIGGGLLLFCPFFLWAWNRLSVDTALAVAGEPKALAEEGSRQKKADVVAEILNRLPDQYGYFWRRKVRLLLVVGEPEQVEAIAPGLAKQRWLEGEGTVLLWGGSLQQGLDEALELRRLNRWCPLDGVVWALNAEQGADTPALSVGARHLRELARMLRWQAPLHLWQVCDGAWRPRSPGWRSAPACAPGISVGCCAC